MNYKLIRMSLSNSYKIIIQGLNENELYDLAKIYLREVDSVKGIVKTNGPYDSGLDLISLKGVEIQYQATIQEKNFETKLLSDLKSASENVLNYGLPSKVKYFYSHPLSNRTVLQFERIAKTRFNITLNIIEANRISEVALEYTEIGDKLRSIVAIDIPDNENFFSNVRVKAFYDLMSFGSTTDIKYSILKSFVLNFLFKNEAVDREQLHSESVNYFNSKIDGAYFDHFLNRLRSEKRIQGKKDAISLSEHEKSRINESLNQFKLEESLLFHEVQKILNHHQIYGQEPNVITKLIEIYESNYAINLSEFSFRETNIDDLQTSTYKLKHYLLEQNTLLVDTNADQLIQQLTQVADKSQILPKIAAGRAYSKVSDPDRLQSYISQNINNKTIFLDTNVLLNLILVHYNQETEYENYYFKVAKQFLLFSKSNGLRLKTIRRYAIETTQIFKDAFSIVPFSKVDAFQSLGFSSNPIFRFYSHLKDHDELEPELNSFEAFLSEFRFFYNKGVNDNHRNAIEYLLNSLEIEIEDFDPYPLAKATELIYQDLKEHHKSKSPGAIDADAIMLCRLADTNSDLNPVDPIFCTWDLSLVRVRKMYFEEFPLCTDWFMFTPTRLMDHFSMMNFQVRPGTVSTELLAILEEQNIMVMTHSLIDSMKIIVNPENIVGLKYTNMLSDLRRKRLMDDSTSTETINDQLQSDTQPLDIIFRKIFESYFMSTTDRNVDNLKKLFVTEKYIEDLRTILLEESKIVSLTGYVSEDFVKKVDDLAYKAASEPN